MSLSFESADEYFQSLSSLAEGLMLDIGDCLKEQNADEKIVEEWYQPILEKFPFALVGSKDQFPV